MKKITIAQKKQFLKDKLSNEPKWAQRALMRIYGFQTDNEKNIEATTDHNDVGFSGVDGEILTSFAKQYQRRGSLSERQMEIVFKKMPKYWKQVMNISDTAMLENQIRKSLIA